MQDIKSRKISVLDAVAIITGMVIGPGIFKTPSIVAANSGNEINAMVFWALGGLVSFIGALCYAELTTAYPHSGGEYHFLVKAFGKRIGFLFAWARMAVIQTGSIAMLSFIIGDYASEGLNLGANSSSIYAVFTIFLLTILNLSGIRSSSLFQKIFMMVMLLGLAVIIVVGLFSDSGTTVGSNTALNPSIAIGSAMIFILLTYGGWNEAAYLSADVSHKKSEMVKVLFYSISLITIIYLVTNFAIIKGLGFENVATSNAVAADLLSKNLSEGWVKVISFIIAISALTTVNAVMITGARTNYALGQDFNNFNFLSRWNNDDNAPINAFIFQTGIAILLITFGTFTRSGFITMVEYTAPVFWFFLFLIGLSLIILRLKEPNAQRSFIVPLFPVTPILFCLVTLYMLHASLVYTGIGSLVGVLVLLIGIPFLFFEKYKLQKET